MVFLKLGTSRRIWVSLDYTIEANTHWIIKGSSWKLKKSGKAWYMGRIEYE